MLWLSPDPQGFAGRAMYGVGAEGMPLPATLGWPSGRTWPTVRIMRATAPISFNLSFFGFHTSESSTAIVPWHPQLISWAQGPAPGLLAATLALNPPSSAPIAAEATVEPGTSNTTPTPFPMHPQLQGSYHTGNKCKQAQETLSH